MGEAAVGSRDLVAEIWRRVAARQDVEENERLTSPPQFTRLADDLERHYVNRHCVLDREPVVHVSGAPSQPLLAPLKRRAARFVVATLDRYFADEEVFLAHLVRLQNDIGAMHDHVAREVVALHETLRSESILLRDRIAALEQVVAQQLVHHEVSDPTTSAPLGA